MLLHGEPGRCRFCECTQNDACRLPSGEPCAWLTSYRDVCNNPRCIQALARAQRAARDDEQRRTAERRREWLDRISGRKRGPRRRKKKAA